MQVICRSKLEKHCSVASYKMGKAKTNGLRSLVHRIVYVEILAYGEMPHFLWKYKSSHLSVFFFLESIGFRSMFFFFQRKKFNLLRFSEGESQIRYTPNRNDLKKIVIKYTQYKFQCGNVTSYPSVGK